MGGFTGTNFKDFQEVKVGDIVRYRHYTEFYRVSAVEPSRLYLTEIDNIYTTTRHSTNTPFTYNEDSVVSSLRLLKSIDQIPFIRIRSLLRLFLNFNLDSELKEFLVQLEL